MTVVLVLEVQPIVHLPDANGLLMGVVLQDHLLEEEECAFVVDALSHLDLRDPGMGCPGLLAVITLLVLHDKLNLESLLHEGVCVDFLLHG